MIRLGAWRIVALAVLAALLLDIGGVDRLPAATLTADATDAVLAAEPDQQVRIAVGPFTTLDPGATFDADARHLMAHLFEGLVRRAEDGAIVPHIAESWEISPDGLTYTFHLRDGPTWSDGRPITAGDFEWAWKRNVDPTVPLGFVVPMAPVANARQIEAGAMDPETLGVNATDSRTLVVTLEEPAAYFLVLVSTWRFLPLRGDVITAYGDT